MLAAALVSLGLHGAMLALPLGARGGQGLVPREAAVLHASLRLSPVAAVAPAVPAEVPWAKTASPVETAAVEARPAQEARAEQPAGALAVAATYFKASQLTEVPRPLTEPLLAPLERLLSGEGATHMTLFIDERGVVAAIDVHSTTLPANAAAQAAAIFSHVRFSPGRIGGFAVKSQIGITVGAAAAQQRSYARQGDTALQ